MRVLHLLSSSKYSGAENVACQIISAFESDKEYEFAYASLDGDIRDSLRERNIRFLPMQKVCVREIRRLINEYKPDIIHAHDPRAICTSVLATKKIPIVGHVHNNRPDFRKKTLLSMMFTFCVRKNRVKHLFWVSNSCLDCFYAREDNKIKEKSSILNNIINTKNLEDKAQQAELQDGTDLVYIGRLTYQKNPERLVEIVEILKKSYPNIKLSIIGSGDLMDTCKQMTEEKGLKDNIKFYGFLSNGYGILKNSKVFLLTSRFEGNPMCVLEAQSFGLPIVSTEIDELKSLVNDKETGYFYNTNEEAAQIISRLLSDKSEYNAVKKNIKKFSVSYNNIQNYKDRIKDIYNK